MAGKETAEKGKEKKPSIDFKKLSKNIASTDEKQHIDQIGPATTDVFLKHAKYTDDKGVVRYKTKFDKKDAEKLVDDLFDALAYHSHRRIFGIDKKQYENLAKLKDDQGNRYIDAITQHHYQVDRDSLKGALAGDDKNTITAGGLQRLLEDPIKKHKQLLLGKLISKEGLNNPEHRDKVKHAIDDIVKEFKLNKKRYNTAKMSADELVGTYAALSQEHYQED